MKILNQTVPYTLSSVGLLWLVGFCVSADQVALADENLAGVWTLALATPGGRLEFELQLDNSEHRWSAAIINGAERIAVDVEVSQERLVLTMPHYDSRIELLRTAIPDRYAGEWTKRRGADSIAKVACTAEPKIDRKMEDPSRFLGRWSVQFSDSDDPAVGIFEQVANSPGVTGTFLTTTGDYRYLQGFVADEQLVLSCFDGAHAFLFKAQIQAGGRLKGDFWAGNWHHETWIAKLDGQAHLPDGFLQTTSIENAKLSDLQFPDLTGRLRTLGEQELHGKATIIEIFGSWCPNCHDEAAYLKELRGKYAARGLRIVGLAFELTGDVDRDAVQLGRYVERFQVDYPVLIAGVSDKQAASESFPVLDRIRSFPTTIFLDSQGKIRAIYTGFSGPATGAEHQRLKARFESIVEKLLAE